MAGLVLLVLAGAALGFMANRRAAIIVAALAWPAYVLGLARGWWGNGVGDGWFFSVVVGTALAATGTAFGVFARRVLLHRWSARM